MQGKLQGIVNIDDINVLSLTKVPMKSTASQIHSKILPLFIGVVSES